MGVGEAQGLGPVPLQGPRPLSMLPRFVLFMSFLTGSRKSRDSPPSRGPRRGGGGRRGPAGLRPIGRRSAIRPIRSWSRLGTLSHDTGGADCREKPGRGGGAGARRLPLQRGRGPSLIQSHTHVCKRGSFTKTLPCSI